eukprot:1159494-Pelagomonas_calceolata.AAC.4
MGGGVQIVAVKLEDQKMLCQHGCHGQQWFVESLMMVWKCKAVQAEGEHDCGHEAAAFLPATYHPLEPSTEQYSAIYLHHPVSADCHQLLYDPISVSRSPYLQEPAFAPINSPAHARWVCLAEVQHLGLGCLDVAAGGKVQHFFSV